MATIFDVANAVRKVNLTDMAKQIVTENAEPILEENRYQLYKGEKPDGGDITPRYRYHWYAQWKHKLNPVPGFGIPDLFITGALHETLKLSTQTFMPYFDSEMAAWPQIAQYKGIFGVSREFMLWQYGPKVFIPELKRRINSILGR